MGCLQRFLMPFSGKLEQVGGVGSTISSPVPRVPIVLEMNYFRVKARRREFKYPHLVCSHLKGFLGPSLEFLWLFVFPLFSLPSSFLSTYFLSLFWSCLLQNACPTGQPISSQRLTWWPLLHKAHSSLAKPQGRLPGL